MNKQQHVHRYRKVNLSRDKNNPYWVYKCNKPLCPHYVAINLAEGQLCECNRCGGMMLITKAVLTHSSNKPMARPHCSDCIKRKNAKDVAALAEFIAGTKT